MFILFRGALDKPERLKVKQNHYIFFMSTYIEFIPENSDTKMTIPYHLVISIYE